MTPETRDFFHWLSALIALPAVAYAGQPFFRSALRAIRGRQLNMMDPPAALLEFVRDGKLRAVAVTGERRFFAVPDTPTVAESGVPGYLVSAWQGLVAPAGLPPAIVNRLNAEVTGLLKEPAVMILSENRCTLFGVML